MALSETQREIVKTSFLNDSLGIKAAEDDDMEPDCRDVLVGANTLSLKFVNFNQNPVFDTCAKDLHKEYLAKSLA